MTLGLTAWQGLPLEQEKPMLHKKVEFGKQQPFSHNLNGPQPGVWDVSSSHAASAENVQQSSGCSVMNDPGCIFFVRRVLGLGIKL